MYNPRQKCWDTKRVLSFPYFQKMLIINHVILFPFLLEKNAMFSNID